MYQPINYGNVDEKIHKFLNKKTPWKTAGKMLSGNRNVVSRASHDGSGIAYEELDWHHTNMSPRSRWQKAH